jgi:hypothetical protein
MKPGEDVMDEKTMDAPVAIFKRVDEHKAKRSGGGRADRIHRGLIHSAQHLHPPLIKDGTSSGLGQT